MLDEGIQAFLPSRVFDPQDMLFNVLAAAMAVAAGAALAWARRWTSRPRRSPQSRSIATNRTKALAAWIQTWLGHREAMASLTKGAVPAR